MIAQHRSKSHILYCYAKEYARCKQVGSLKDVRLESDGSMSAIPNGRSLFWLLFCYDIFILTHCNSLSIQLLERIKQQKCFQGARYELAVAAIFLRAGFEIRWIDTSNDKTCEFEATHKKTGIKVGVEAKSRNRKGVLHEPPGSSSKRGLDDLLRDAIKKRTPNGIPLIIFLDVNLPFTSGQALTKPLVTEVARAIGTFPKNGDLFTLFVVTNFPFHYDDLDGIAAPPENVIVFPHNNVALDQVVLDDLQKSLNRYTLIPEEV